MKRKKIIFELINDVILCMIAFLCIYPFLYDFCAISDGRYLAAGQVTFFPKGVNLEVFEYVLTIPSWISPWE